MAASLAVKFASRGESTLIASTDPAHSLGDSFEQVSERLCCLHSSRIDSLVSVLTLLVMLCIGFE